MPDNRPKFIDGLIVKKPKDGLPEFIKGTISIKREELIFTLQGMTGDWINLDIKESKKTGNWYAALNEWKRENDESSQGQAFTPPQPRQEAPPIDPNPGINTDDIPF